MGFEGTAGYVATNDLRIAVNAAIVLQQPLLVKAEPGTGKTVWPAKSLRHLSSPSSNGTSNPPPRRSGNL